MTFNLDIAIVAGYMLLCLVIGLFKYGKIKNIRDYTLGAKYFPTTVLLATTFATAIDARQIIGNVGKVYELGLVFIIPLFFIPISWLVLAKLMASNLQTFHKHNFISLTDIMEYWYGKTARHTTNIVTIIVTIGITATSSMAIGYLLNYFLNIPEVTGAIIGLIIVTGYSVLGGITSVAFTDVFQFLIFFIALPIACLIGYQNTEGLKELWSSLPSQNTSISSENIALLISFIVSALIPNSDVPFIQRSLMAKNKRQFLQSFIGVAILLVPLLIIVCMISLITYHHNPSIESGKILYYFIDHYLPIGLKGLMIVGLLAVIMSSQDSYLNSASVLLSHNVCKNIWPSITHKQELLIARVSCIIIALISLSIIFLKNGIMETIWFVCNFIPVIVIPFIAGLLGIKSDKKSFKFVVLSSLITITIARFFTESFNTKSLTIGVITSAITLYIIHKRYKKEPLLSLSKINMNLLFDKLNARVLSNSFSVGSLYTVGTILGINLILGMIFSDLNYFNILNCSFIIIASLLILLIFNEFWHHNLKKYIGDVWRFSLIIGLVFIPSYIMFANNFHILWLCNFVLSVILFFIITDFVVGTAFTLIATSVSYLLPQIFHNDSDLISINFAIISCSLILIAIIIQFYNRHSITKSAHKEIMYELKNIMQERILESINIKEEFLNKLNHEMRIPLSVMINTSDGIYQMWDKLSDKEKKKYLKDIVDNRKRFESYTSNILDLADLKQKRFKLNLKPNIDLIKLSKDVIDRATQIIIDKNKNLKIRLELKNTKSAIINCDEARINQALDNLLSNSIKFSNSGIIKVIIHPTKDDIEISISDQGVGVPKNERSKIFEPFFEGSRTKSPAEGKGLGLSIVQQIIILHKGSIKIEDNKSKGTIFTVMLPRKLSDSLKEEL